MEKWWLDEGALRDVPDAVLVAELSKRGGSMGAVGEALTIVVGKSQDYNAGAVDRDSYFPLGLASYAQMLHTKSLRLVSLASKPRDAVFESARDTALDIINYASFLADWLKRTEALAKRLP